MTTIIILFLTAILTMFVGVKRSAKLVKVIAILGLIIALMANLMGLNLNVIMFSKFYELQKSSILLSNVSLWITLFIFVLSGRVNADYRWQEFYPLLLFSLTGAHVLYGFTHLLTFFVGVEILSIPLYVMAASARQQNESLEAGLKYYILGAFSSAIMLFSLALIYGALGSLDFMNIAQTQMLHNKEILPLFQVGIVMLMISLLFKFAMVPFHSWAPDVYSGSPTLVTAFMAAIVKVAIANAFLYLFNGFFPLQSPTWTRILFVSAVMSMILSNVVALYQKNAKRLMAYSSISHAAFMLLGLTVAYQVRNPFVFQYYLISYVVVSTGIFLIIDHLSSANKGSDDLSIFEGLYQQQPILAVLMTIFLMSMAGIPLTAGFMAKFQVLYGIYSINVLLFVISLIASAISIAYYLRVLNQIFTPATALRPTASRPVLLYIITICIGLFTVLAALNPEASLEYLGYFMTTLNLKQSS